jgi:transcription termination/antitermination protein NusG
MYNFDEESWHVLFVMTGDEDNVKERLLYRFKNSDLRILVPKRKLRERRNGVWETRVRTLFPGYVLLNGRVGLEEYYAFNGVPGLIRVLRDKSGILRIEQDEISVLSRLICDNEIIGPSDVYMDNGRVVVIDGPLLGMEGSIESIDRRKGRVKVRLNFIGEARLVELSITMVQAA